jgi:hypothetical protein
MYELVQVHEHGDYAEVVIRTKQGERRVLAGNIYYVHNPRAYYPPAEQHGNQQSQPITNAAQNAQSDTSGDPAAAGA